MKARIFVLVVLAAGFVMAEDNATTAPGVVAPAVTLAPAVQPSAAPPQPGVLTPGHEIGRTPPSKNADGRYDIAGVALFKGPQRELIRRDLTKDIAVHEIEWYSLGSIGLSLCCGLDYAIHSTGDVITCTHPDDDRLYFLDLDTLAIEDSWDLHTSNTNAFGNFVGGGMYLNDWANTDYFHGTGGPWTVYANPAGNSGRGMDYDYTHTSLVWQAHSDLGGGVYSLVSFTRGATTGTWYDISAYIPDQMSGLAVFDSEGRTGIAVNVYHVPEIFFFEFDGANVEFLGSRALPWANVTGYSWGLAYSSQNGLFYYAFRDTLDQDFISKLRIDLRALFEDGFERGDDVDWACDGQCYPDYTFDCDPASSCFCITTTEGYGACIDSDSCSNPSCASSADCRPGWICVTCTACPTNVCVRRQCTDGSAPLPQGESAGMTISGR